MSELSGGRLYPGEEVAQSEAAFLRKLQARKENDSSLDHRILTDRFDRRAYKRRQYDRSGAIEKIHLLSSNGERRDLASESLAVAALKPLNGLRVYIEAEDDEAAGLVRQLIQEVKK